MVPEIYTLDRAQIKKVIDASIDIKQNLSRLHEPLKTMNTLADYYKFPDILTDSNVIAADFEFLKLMSEQVNMSILFTAARIHLVNDDVLCKKLNWCSENKNGAFDSTNHDTDEDSDEDSEDSGNLGDYSPEYYRGDDDPEEAQGDGPPVGAPGDGPPVGAPGDGPPVGAPGDGPPVGAPGDGPPVGAPGDGPPEGAPDDGPLEGAPGDGPPVGAPGDDPPEGAPDDGPLEVAPGDGPPEGAPGDFEGEEPPGEPYLINGVPFEYIYFDIEMRYWDLTFSDYVTDDSENDGTGNSNYYNHTYHVFTQADIKSVIKDLSVLDKYESIIFKLFNNNTEALEQYKGHNNCIGALSYIKNTVLPAYKQFMMESNEFLLGNQSLEGRIFNESMTEQLNIIFSALFHPQYPSKLDKNALEDIDKFLEHGKSLTGDSKDIYFRYKNYDGNRFNCEWPIVVFSQHVNSKAIEQEGLTRLKTAANDIGISVKKIKDIIFHVGKKFNKVDKYNEAMENYLNNSITKKKMAEILTNDEVEDWIDDILYDMNAINHEYGTIVDRVEEILGALLIINIPIEWDSIPMAILDNSDNLPLTKLLMHWFMEQNGTSKVQDAINGITLETGIKSIEDVNHRNIWKLFELAMSGLTDFSTDIHASISVPLNAYGKLLEKLQDYLESYLDKTTTMGTDVLM